MVSDPADEADLANIVHVVKVLGRRLIRLTVVLRPMVSLEIRESPNLLFVLASSICSSIDPRVSQAAFCCGRWLRQVGGS